MNILEKMKEFEEKFGMSFMDANDDLSLLCTEEECKMFYEIKDMM